MDAFAGALLGWYTHHGRHDLPWQRDRSPYRVWISEIMLQQTQVATVIAYYQRFMQRFPDVAALAAAPIDEVLHLWSGLGYYSRARNLHRAAQSIVGSFNGELPIEREQLARLPGIGRSTAAAILALSQGRREAILDGNVRRVLARYFAIDGATGQRTTERALWERAEQCTPEQDVAAYTQAIMDLGATLCTRRQPLCEQCPVQSDCAAYRMGRVHELPPPRRRAARPVRSVVMLLVQRDTGGILLQRRPARGIWGGLWAPPQFDTVAAAERYCSTTLRAGQIDAIALPLLRHAFTHFELQITPLRARCEGFAGVMEGADTLWYNPREPLRIGLPAPIAALLAAFGNLTL